MAYTKNTWVDQVGQVRYTETEDDGYKVFTPNFEEVTEMGTPVNALNMNHIEDGIEACYTDLVKRKSTSSATGNTMQPVYIKADGTVEVCNEMASGTVIDGQWVNKQSRLSTANTIGTYTIDVSTYLPNDNFDYQIDLFCRIISKSNNATSVWLHKGASWRLILCGDSYNTSYEQPSTTNLIYAVSGRFFQMTVSDHNCISLELVAYGYRRIGTNV